MKEKYKEIVFKAILRLQKEREDQSIIPCHVSSTSLLKLINNGIRYAIEELKKEGEIKEVDTIHGKSFEIIKKDE